MILFDIELLEKRLNDLESKTASQDFWNKDNKQENVLKEINSIKYTVENYNKIKDDLENLIEYNQLLLNSNLIDENEENELSSETNKIEKEINKLEISTLFSGKYDKNNAIVTIHPGAGGTEAQDWANMLYRMYLRWAEQNNFKTQELDYLEGEEAGIKSVSFLVTGNYAYGNLKSEHGVHRLVRVSPFDAGGRRHTSFASVEVLPEIEDDDEIIINPEDIKMDVFRSSGARRTTY